MSGVSVVAMPWAAPDTPSIQLGVLTALAVDAELPVAAHSMHLEAAGFFAGNGVDLADYEAVVHHWWTAGLGEWIFATTEGDGPPDPAGYLRYLRAEEVRCRARQRERRGRQ